MKQFPLDKELHIQALRTIQNYTRYHWDARHKAWNMKGQVTSEIWSNIAWLVYLELRDESVGQFTES